MSQDEDAPAKLINFVEDTLLVNGLPFTDQAVPTMLGDILRRVGSEQWSQWADEASMSHGLLLALMIAAMVGNLISQDDAERAAMPRRRNTKR